MNANERPLLLAPSTAENLAKNAVQPGLLGRRDGRPMAEHVIQLFKPSLNGGWRETAASRAFAGAGAKQAAKQIAQPAAARAGPGLRSAAMRELPQNISKPPADSCLSRACAASHNLSQNVAQTA